MKKNTSLLKNNKGFDQYLQFAILILIGIMMLYGIVESAVLFTNVVKVNKVAEVVAKKIQLDGAVDDGTAALLNDAFDNSTIEEYQAVIIIREDSGEKTIVITKDNSVNKQIQLNDSYTVIVKGETDFLFGKKEIGGKAIGISEVYHK